MKLRHLLMFAVLAFSTGAVATAQTRTVTNADLEKFKEQRIAAAREYAENYEKWMMPSPEELKFRRDQGLIDKEELADRLRAARLERDRAQASVELSYAELDQRERQELRENEREQFRIQMENQTQYPYGYDPYGGGYYDPYGRRYGRSVWDIFRNPGGYNRYPGRRPGYRNPRGYRYPR